MKGHSLRSSFRTVLQTTLVIILSLVAVAGHAQESSMAVTPADTLPRVRTSDPVIAVFIREAIASSATFRRLIDIVNTSNGLVYIDSGYCQFVPACLVFSVTAAGPHRILRILVNTGRDAAHVKAAIGHELSHAIEVLSQPNLTTGADLFFFYDRARRTNSGARLTGAVFETDAAIRAGDAVHAEIKARAAASRKVVPVPQATWALSLEK